MSKSKRQGGSPSEQSKKDTPRTAVAKGRRPKRSGGAKGESAAPLTNRPRCEKCGQVHTKCNAHTKHGPNTGKPCGANPPAMQLLCVKHGGNNPTHRAKGRALMLEMRDPFLAELRRVVLDPDTDASVKVRGIQVLLDRIGYGPGMHIEIGVSKFDEALGTAFNLDPVTGQPLTGVDRSLDGLEEPDPRRVLPSAAGGGVGPDGWEDVDQAQHDAQADAWRDLDNEDARDYEAGRIRPDENTVRGEVVPPVQSRYDVPPDPGPTDPPGYTRERPARRP